MNIPVKLILLAGILLLGIARPAAANLLGQTVMLDYYSQPGGTQALDFIADDTVTVANPDVEIAYGDSSNLGSGWLFPGESIDLLGDSILLTFEDVVTFGVTITGYSGTVTDISGTVLSAPCTSHAQNCAIESGDLFSGLSIAPDGSSFSFTFTAANYNGGNDPGGIGQLNIVFAPVPLPAALPLFAAGLGALGLSGWRRKTASQSAS